jgi:photosystem II stability/assembly factor-like uncharacterized protein
MNNSFKVAPNYAYTYLTGAGLGGNEMRTGYNATPPGTGPKWSGVVASSDFSVIAGLKTNLSALIYTTSIVISTNSGITWNTYTFPNQTKLTHVIPIKMSSNGTVIALYIEIAMYISTNTGVTWNTISFDNLKNLDYWNPHFWMSDNGNIMVLSLSLPRQGSINTPRISTNTGATWTNYTLSFVPTAGLFSATGFVGGTPDASVIYLHYNKEYIAYSTDLGKTWNSNLMVPGAINTVIKPIQNSLLCSGTKICCVVGTSYFYYSSNFGQTWTSMTISPSRGGTLNLSSILGTPDLSTIVVFDGVNGSGYYSGYISTNLGVSWTVIQPRLGPYISGWYGSYALSSDGLRYLIGPSVSTTTDTGYITIINFPLTSPSDILDIYAPYTSGSSTSTGLYILSKDPIWIQQTNSGIRNWVSIATSSDGQKLAACAANDYIYTSTNAGQTWTQRSSTGTQAWQAIVSSPNGNILHSCVNNGYIWRSVDSGNSWTVKWEVSNWTYVAASSDGVNIFGCENGLYMWRSTNSGENWNAAAIDEQPWTCVVCSSDGIKVAATVMNGNIWTSINKGYKWIERTSSGMRPWSTIACSSNGTILIACANPGYIYISTDSGVSWNVKTTSGSRNWKNVSCSTNGEKIYACAENDYIYESTNTGNTWVSIVYPGVKLWRCLAGTDGIPLAGCIQNNVIYTRIAPQAQEVGSMLQGYSSGSRNGNTGIYANRVLSIGGSWERRYLYLAMTNTWSSQKLLTHSWNRQYYHLSVNEYFWISKNNGLFYNRISSYLSVPNLYQLNGISCITDDGKIIFTRNNSLALVYSSDGGTTWSFKTNPNSFHIKTIRCTPNADILYGCGGTNTLAKSTDYGGTWSRYYNAVTDDSFKSIKTYNGTIFACVSTNYIYTSIDTGVSWKTVYYSASITWVAVNISFDGTKIAAASTNGNVYLSTDSGSSWTSVSVTSSLSCFAGSSNGNILVGAGGGSSSTDNGFIWKSTNAGITWNKLIFYSGSPSVDTAKPWWKVAISSNGEHIAATVNQVNNYIYLALDSANTITAKTQSGSQHWKAITISNNKVISSCIVNNNYVTSTNGGNNWYQNQYGGNNADYLSMAINDDGSFIAATVNLENTSEWQLPQRLYTTTNYGVTWSEMSNISVYGYQIKKSGVTLYGNTLAVCQTPGTNLTPSTIIVSTNRGSTWRTGYISDRLGSLVSANEAGFMKITRDGSKMCYIFSNYFYITINSNTMSTTIFPNDPSAIYFTDIATSDYFEKIYLFSNVSYRSVDYGTSWVKLSIPNITSGTCSSDGSIVVVIVTSTVYKSTNSGDTWLTMPSLLIPDNQFNTTNISSTTSQIVSSADCTTLVYMRGEGSVNVGACYTSSNGGYTWAQSYSSQTETFGDYAAMSRDGNVCVAINAQARIHVSRDRGDSYQKYTVPALANVLHFRDIAISDNGQVIVILDFYNSNNFYSRVCVSTNTGNTWRVIETPKYFYNLRMSSNGSFIYAVGSNTSNNDRRSIYRSTDYCVTWLKITPDNTLPINVTGIVTSSDGSKNIVYTDYNNIGQIYTSTDFGVTWIEKTIPGGVPRLSYWDNVTLSEDGNIIFIAHAFGLYTSTNFGISWKTTVVSHIGERYKPKMTSDGSLMIVTFYNVYSNTLIPKLGAIGIFVSIDKGQAWSIKILDDVLEGTKWNGGIVGLLYSGDGTNIQIVWESGPYNYKSYGSSGFAFDIASLLQSKNSGAVIYSG